jgi:hypothetical protein
VRLRQGATTAASTDAAIVKLPAVLDILGRMVHLEGRRPLVTRGGPRGRTLCGIAFVCRAGLWTRDPTVIRDKTATVAAGPVASCVRCLVLEGARDLGVEGGR